MSATALPLKVQSYFAEWVQALATACSAAAATRTALALAEDVVGGIQARWCWRVHRTNRRCSRALARMEQRLNAL
jgi:hypothetical protein